MSMNLQITMFPLLLMIAPCFPFVSHCLFAFLVQKREGLGSFLISVAHSSTTGDIVAATRFCSATPFTVAALACHTCQWAEI